MGTSVSADSARIEGVAEPIRAIARLMEAPGPTAARDQIVSEAQRLLGTSWALLLLVAESDDPLQVVATAPPLPATSVALADVAPLARIAGDDAPLQLLGKHARELIHALGVAAQAGAALLLPMRRGDSVHSILILADADERTFSGHEVEVAAAFAAAAAASLAQVELAADGAGGDARQAAFVRAAKSLTESLDPGSVLARICEEAAKILDGDSANVYLGDAADGLRVEAAFGAPPELIGARLEPGEGLAGVCAVRGEPVLTNDYPSLSRPVQLPGYDRAHSALAVPMTWDGALHGVLTVVYTRPRPVMQKELAVLEGFAELAAACCRNASAHAGLAQAARTDALTGCLNHAAMHDTLRRELDRAARTGHSVSLAIVDLDDFKQVNERHGHLAGDEVLRRVGGSLRRDVRAYDVVARYGGDEFAIVAIDADERRAMEVAQRAIEGIAGAVAGLDAAEAAGRATAGVAEWQPGESPTQLIARADATLLHGKQGGLRGVAIPASELPDDVDPLRAQRAAPALVDEADGGVPRDRVREQTERLRLRTRQLALANDLGTRVAGMTDPHEILEAAVEELNEAFGWYLCAILRIRDDGYLESVAVRGGAVHRLPEAPWSQPLTAGLIGRAVAQRRPVLSGDVHAEPDYRFVPELADVRSELVVPLWVAGELWGAIDVEDVRGDAFDEDDARLLQTVADQVGSALRSATLYQQLDSAYVGTAEALAAALEAKDARAAMRSAAVAQTVRAVGVRLGLDQRALRTLRLGAIFHDIGNVGVPRALLEKRGRLTRDERDVVERHAVLGERILAPIEFLDDVRELVRHEHERWDGGGYPDGLAGDAIPLGSRIISACDAYDAMLTDRPYRAALSPRQARAEMDRCAGTQFDPRVVAALLAELDERAEAGDPAQPAVSESR